MYDLLRSHFNKYVQLSQEEFEQSITHFRYKKFRKHQYILQDGEISRYETYILSGCTRSYEVDDDGQEHIIQFGLEDWWVGDMYSFLSATPSRLNIDCLEETEVLQISQESHDQLCSNIPKLERHFRKLVQNAYCAAVQRIYSNLSKTALERYDDFVNKYPQIEQRVPNNLIASYLGITPQSLSRLRNQRVKKKARGRSK
jgi:CRP-like cAMP-binding protein